MEKVIRVAWPVYHRRCTIFKMNGPFNGPFIWKIVHFLWSIGNAILMTFSINSAFIGNPLTRIKRRSWSDGLIFLLLREHKFSMTINHISSYSLSIWIEDTNFDSYHMLCLKYSLKISCHLSNVKAWPKLISLYWWKWKMA